jgi:hypothetical protein
MSDDNVMYDSPLEMMQDAVSSGSCDVQSVIPIPEGGYRCACSCLRWEIVVDDRGEGLRQARKHTDEGLVA